MRRQERERCEVLIAPRGAVGLRQPTAVRRWMEAARPRAVFMAAAEVGGRVGSDTYRADLHDNLMIEANVIEAARRAGVETWAWKAVRQ